METYVDLERVRRSSVGRRNHCQYSTAVIYRGRCPDANIDSKLDAVCAADSIPKEETAGVENIDLRKRARYLRRCKDVFWSRWTNEYLKSLRERHKLKHKTKQMTAKRGDAVLIKADERNRGKWKIGIIESFVVGRDGVIRGAWLRAGKSHIERAMQHLFPMESSCDIYPTEDIGTNEKQEKSSERTTRAAAVEVRERIANISRNELDELD